MIGLKTDYELRSLDSIVSEIWLGIFVATTLFIVMNREIPLQLRYLPRQSFFGILLKILDSHFSGKHLASQQSFSNGCIVGVNIDE